MIQIIDLMQEAEKYIYLQGEIVIENNDQFKGMSENLKKVKEYKKKIDEQRKSELEPFQDKVKEINSKYKDTLEKLDSSIKTIEYDLKIYMQKEEARKRQAELEARKKAEEQERKLKAELEKTKQEAEQAGDSDFAKSLEIQIQNVKIESPVINSDIESISGQHTRKIWKGELIDINKVPKKYLKEFFKLDESALNQFARKNEGKIEIPGFRFYQDVSIVNR